MKENIKTYSTESPANDFSGSDNFTNTEERKNVRTERLKQANLETKNELTKLIQKGVEHSVDNPVLNALERGELSKEAYIRIRADHYHSADWFMDLLDTGETKSRNAGYADLAEEFRLNFRDEDGYDVKTGIRDPNESHEAWRIDDGKAIGVDYTKILPVLSTIKGHRDPLKKDIKNKSALYLAGMLTVTEKYLVEEFKKIQRSRDLLFPEAYVENENDLPEVKIKKARARKYIDDHIGHDINHYTDILAASMLVIDKLGPNEKQQFKDGCMAVLKAKSAMYAGLEEYLKANNLWTKN